ncbi:LPS-assembly protein LptD [Exilibacterium tricleocarpae]|uniref:LPS-assembly protein LptD n=1 Tax=Exilibacterium tricleocarpae TaxID=2591008 RepID=A0A545T3J8_9GAMM|nr:LPS-assembly protein LptD [Exilibacterium tricleocarpae]TQV71786.1 LPS-assembly protein LptD [Exilibacterium tricleocarpae]
MAEPRQRLRQDIYRHIQQQSRQTGSPSALIGLALLALQPILPVQAQTGADASHRGWDCRPGANPSAWDCREIQLPGPGGRQTQQPPDPAETATATSASQIDWVPAQQLSETRRAELANNCCGAYVEPERTDDEANLAPAQAPLRASADRAEVLQQTTTVLEGEVFLRQGERELHADKAQLDDATRIATLEGNIRLRQPGLLMTGDRAQIHMDDNRASLEQAEFVIHEAHTRGSADRLEQTDKHLLVLDNGNFTSCEPDSDAWLLEGSEIVLDSNEEVGRGKHVRLEVAGVPIFYAPYLEFPLGDTRKSGFLFPYLSSSDIGGGLNAGVPYYFNLAPNYDLTLTPSHMDDRGEMLEAEFRHLSRYFQTTVNAAFLGDDKDGDDKDDEKRVERGRIDFAEGRITAGELAALEAKLGEFEGEDRWLFNLDQIGGLGQRWSTRIDFTQVSDTDYFRDLDTASLSVNANTHLRRLGQFDYRTDNWLLSARAEEYQTLFSTRTVLAPYRLVPELSAAGVYRAGNWLFNLDNTVVRFDHPDAEIEDLNRRQLTGDRARLEYKATWDKEWLWGFFKPAVALKHLSYQLDDNLATPLEQDAPAVTVPQGTVDMGLIFERDGALFGNAYLQTFEPQLFYFYSDFKDQSELARVDFDTSEPTFTYSQLFRDSRFTGGDRIDDANQLTLGLTSRFISPESGVERLSLSLGQIYIFEDRRVTLAGAPSNANKTEIAARVAAQVGKHWQFTSELLYDEEEQVMSQGNFSLRYMDDQYRLFNLGHRFRRQAGRPDVNDIDNDGDTTELIENDLDQVDASLIWPLYGGLSLVARYNKDLTQQRELEKIAGLEYNSCCYRVRAVWRRWIDNDLIDVVDDSLLEFDEGVFFEVEFKGLGGTGGTISSVLSEGIFGYERREENLR